MQSLLSMKQLPEHAREKLLFAAMTLFASPKGFKETSILDVVEVARVSKTTFYNFFHSKEELLSTLFEQLADEFLQEVEKAILKEKRVAYKGYAGIRRYMELCKQHKPITQVLLVASVGVSEEVEEVRRKAHNRFAAVIYETVRGVLPETVSEQEMKMASQAMVGAINEVIIQHLMVSDEAEVEPVARLLNRITVGSFTSLAMGRTPLSR
ncbi:transcriptional regulator, TetR family [Melghirimyces thermohalophilus]|uniref:Transcriptional regulator, TetR family n=1 Tax=Melghirimyces thermohalophilus TaxID=1236220 RepID=A0A1G6JET7_9BACL|nr:TetR/AcrR family transcriptional regulator [Melghirimyces thermohalophilus]SDC17241.1 transcriptional regulator, TetR family [Melghirimyces thermohalophilus]